MEWTCVFYYIWPGGKTAVLRQTRVEIYYAGCCRIETDAGRDILAGCWSTCDAGVMLRGIVLRSWKNEVGRWGNCVWGKLNEIRTHQNLFRKYREFMDTRYSGHTRGVGACAVMRQIFKNKPKGCRKKQQNQNNQSNQRHHSIRLCLRGWFCVGWPRASICTSSARSADFESKQNSVGMGRPNGRRPARAPRSPVKNRVRRTAACAPGRVPTIEPTEVDSCFRCAQLTGPRPPGAREAGGQFPPQPIDRSVEPCGRHRLAHARLLTRLVRSIDRSTRE